MTGTIMTPPPTPKRPPISPAAAPPSTDQVRCGAVTPEERRWKSDRARGANAWRYERLEVSVGPDVRWISRTTSAKRVAFVGAPSTTAIISRPCVRIHVAKQ